MNLDSRLNQVEKALNEKEDLFPDIPDFDNWNDEKLNQYIVSHTNKFHSENKIECFEDAEKIYKHYLSRELISKEEFDLFIKVEREFWDKASQSDGEVFFVE